MLQKVITNARRLQVAKERRCDELSRAGRVPCPRWQTGGLAFACSCCITVPITVTTLHKHQNGLLAFYCFPPPSHPSLKQQEGPHTRTAVCNRCMQAAVHADLLPSCCLLPTANHRCPCPPSACPCSCATMSALLAPAAASVGLQVLVQPYGQAHVGHAAW